jgi:Flp pilus assembly protein TadB
MAEQTRKEEIQQFRNLTTERDFQRLKEKVNKGEVAISIGRDKSRSLLKRTQAAYYYSFFGLAIALSVLTVYLVSYGNKWYTAFSFATTVMVMIVFWRSMTKRMSVWSMEEKNNFDYAYFTNVISVKKGDQEYNYPDEHWKEVL